MKKILTALVSLLFAFCLVVAAQDSNSNSSKSTKSRTKKSTTSQGANANSNTGKKKRGPVFRANADQVKQAQTILKQRNFYAGELTGKLDDATRDGLKKYQEAEKIKVTGTLNRLTLEKMGITLTDKQKTM